jgi:hypothetical protein
VRASSSPSPPDDQRGHPPARGPTRRPARPLGRYCLEFAPHPELEAMVHLLGRYCLDFDPHPELEAIAHPLGLYCLDFDPHPEPEAMAHPLGRRCLDFDPSPELEAMAHPLGRYCLDFEHSGPAVGGAGRRITPREQWWAVSRPAPRGRAGPRTAPRPA